MLPNLTHLTTLLPYMPLVLLTRPVSSFSKHSLPSHNNKLPRHEKITAVVSYSNHYSLTWQHSLNFQVIIYINVLFHNTHYFLTLQCVLISEVIRSINLLSRNPLHYLASVDPVITMLPTLRSPLSRKIQCWISSQHNRFTFKNTFVSYFTILLLPCFAWLSSVSPDVSRFSRRS